MKISLLAGTSALALCLTGLPALAEVTPEEVWENWKASASQGNSGLTTQSEAREGDTLVISGVGFAPEGEGAATIDGEIEEIRLTDLGDGTVEITLSEEFSLTITTPAMDGIEPPVAETVTLTVTLPGTVTVASGDPEAVSYVSEMPSMEVSLTAPDDAAEPFDMALTMTNATATQLSSGPTDGSGPMTTSGDFAAESLSIAVKGKDPEGTEIDMTGAIGGLSGRFDGVILPEDQMADMGAALDAGFAIHGDGSWGASTFAANVTDAAGPMAIAGSAAGGSTSFAMDKAGLVYNSASNALELTVSGAQIPLPEVKVTLAETAFGVTMPLMPTEEPAPYTLLVKLVDFAVPEELWAMVDPAGGLGHDPATVILDTKGTMQLTSALDQVDAAPPMLHSFDLTQLLVKALGAELTGSGALTFDNADMTTIAGVPAPTGMLDLKLTGANAIVDQAIAMGLITEEDAMGFRMMASMFANTAPDKDEMTSVVEFKDKHLFVNGQQLQ